MVFKEIWISLLSGFGLLTSSSTLFASNFLSSDTKIQNTSSVTTSMRDKATNNDDQEKKQEDAEKIKEEIKKLQEDQSFNKDYSSKAKASGWEKALVTNGDKSTYLLQKPREELTFSSPIDFRDEDLEKIKTSEVKVYLFSSSIWSKSELEEDQFKQISKEETASLFRGLDHNKVKRILLQLNTKRIWIKSHISSERHYISAGILKTDKANTLKWLKIKYFKTAGALRKFIYEKITKNPGDCNISDNELKNILEQDKKSFFDDIK